VPDPYYRGASEFDRVLDYVEDACEGLLQALVLADVMPRRALFHELSSHPAADLQIIQSLSVKSTALPLPDLAAVR
jgi:hypothetical protein